MTERMPRLGFPAQILERPNIQSHDTRRWKSDPHMRISFYYEREIFDYLTEAEINVFRLASGLTSYATHPDPPQLHPQVEECISELAELGKIARGRDIRLPFHPGQCIVLDAPDDDLTNRSTADIEVQANILEALGLDDHPVVLVHIGGVYNHKGEAIKRFATRFSQLSQTVQRRLVVENDDQRVGVDDVLKLHYLIGIRIVFDAHHYLCFNPSGLDPQQAVKLFLRTWEGWEAHPKINFTSPRLDWGFRHASENGRKSPNWRSHAEFIDPFHSNSSIFTIPSPRKRQMSC
jgi:UV DNA damage endonuclease